VEAVRRFEQEFLAYVETEYPEVPHDIRTTKDLSDSDQARLHEAAKKFKTVFGSGTSVTRVSEVAR
jgi:F-type H+-transporting ATPase subunit alpha